MTRSTVILPALDTDLDFKCFWSDLAWKSRSQKTALVPVGYQQVRFLWSALQYSLVLVMSPQRHILKDLIVGLA